jgi:nucleotide-binding universal stress UspA family protein
MKLSRTASLVVVGCDDVNPAAALLLGSTSLTLATHGVCPVVVWRGVATPNTKSVVVGVDGTPAGAAALAAAFEYADRFKLSIKAVHSWSTTVPAGGVTIPFLIDWDALEAAEWALLTHAVDEWSTRYPDVDVRLFVEPIKPGRALLRHLDDAQLVVVGNRRQNALTAAVLGSTSLNLLHHSRVPVMVCHAPDGAEH